MLNNPTKQKLTSFSQISSKPICKLQFSHKKETTWNSTTNLNRLGTILKHYTTELLFLSNRANTGNTVSTAGGRIFIRHLDTTGTATNYAGKPRRRWRWWKRSRRWEIHWLKQKGRIWIEGFSFKRFGFRNGGKLRHWSESEVYQDVRTDRWVRLDISIKNSKTFLQFYFVLIVLNYFCMLKCPKDIY